MRPPKEGRRPGSAATARSLHPSSLQAAVAGSGYPTDKPRRQKPEDEVESLRPEPTGIPLSSARSAPRPEGGVASGRRGEARRRVGGFLPGPGRAFPVRSPASSVLWSRPSPLPCWIVRPPPPPPLREGWGRSWEFSAVAGVRGQRPSGPILAGRELGASLSQRGPKVARRRRLRPSTSSSSPLRRSCEMWRL